MVDACFDPDDIRLARAIAWAKLESLSFLVREDGTGAIELTRCPVERCPADPIPREPAPPRFREAEPHPTRRV